MEWLKWHREEGGDVRNVVERRDVEVLQQERFEKIQRSRWNRWYKERMRMMRIPRYLRERGGEERMIRIARFRLGSERGKVLGEG